MPECEPDPLPEAYLRLLEAQRYVTPQEQAERDEDTKRDQLASRIRRRLPRVY